MNPYEIVGWLLVVILSGFILLAALTVVATIARVSKRRQTARSIESSIDQLNAFSQAVRDSLKEQT